MMNSWQELRTIRRVLDELREHETKHFSSRKLVELRVIDSPELNYNAYSSLEIHSMSSLAQFELHERYNIVELLRAREWIDLNVDDRSDPLQPSEYISLRDEGRKHIKCTKMFEYELTDLWKGYPTTIKLIALIIGGGGGFAVWKAVGSLINSLR